MVGEMFPGGAVEAAQVRPEDSEAIFFPDGSLNEEALLAQCGLGPDEANQNVSFGTHTGTVAEMLNDPKCPVGGIIRDAYRESGIEGVAEKFKGLSVLDSRFSVDISPATLTRESVKKNSSRQ